MNRQRSSPRFPWIVLTTWLAALLLGTAALAQLPAGEKAIAVSLVAEDATPAAGETVTLAFVMTPKEGWHGYWKNPGDAGVQPSVEWGLPTGVKAGPRQWPVTGRRTCSGRMKYVLGGAISSIVRVGWQG